VTGLRTPAIAQDQARREAACAFDDAMRSFERDPQSGVSNRAVGDACGVDEKVIRLWREPNRGKPMPQWAEYCLPPQLQRRFAELRAARLLALRGEGGAHNAVAQSHVAVCSMATAIRQLSASTADQHYTGDEARQDLPGLLDVQRDVGRLIGKLQVLAASDADAAGHA
jgi:hypothetical protein